MLKQRVLAGVVLVPLGIAAILYLPHPAFAGLAAVIFGIGAWEWSRLAGFDEFGLRAFYTLAVVVTVAAVWWLGSQQLYYLATIAGGTAWIIATFWLSNFEMGKQNTELMKLTKALLGWVILLACFAAAVSLHALPSSGARWVLVALAAVWITDTAAYFSGRAFGKRKMAPRISPNKTWAGAAGGFCGAMLFIGGALYALIGPQVSPIAIVVLGLVTTAFAMIGDLFVSLLKRHRSIKDTGKIIPGHGGILDRFDGVLAALPMFVIAKGVLGL